MNLAERNLSWPKLDRVPEDRRELWAGQKGWRGEHLTPADWEIAFPPALLDAIIRISETISDPRRAAQELARHPECADLQRKVERMLGGGIGFCVLKGLTKVGDNTATENMFLAIGSLFGQPVSQTKKGNLLARVEDLSLELANPNVRGHQTSAELAFHCDRADRILLCCIRRAQSGGESSIVSSIHLHDELRARRADLAAILEAPLPQDRRGEHEPHELPFCELPVFSRSDRCFVARYLRRFIHDSQRHSAAPRLTEAAVSGLDLLDSLMQAEGVALKMLLLPGDIQILNNNVVFHARTSFQDRPDARRLLFRLWLAHRSSRPLPPSFSVLYGSVGAGALRGGVWPPAVAVV